MQTHSKLTLAPRILFLSRHLVPWSSGQVCFIPVVCHRGNDLLSARFPTLSPSPFYQNNTHKIKKSTFTRNIKLNFSCCYRHVTTTCSIRSFDLEFFFQCCYLLFERANLFTKSADFIGLGFQSLPELIYVIYIVS